MENDRRMNEMTNDDQLIEGNSFEWEVAIPAPNITFSQGEEVGTLTWADGTFRFDGNHDESAKLLLDYLNKHLGGLKLELSAELDIQTKALEAIRDGYGVNHHSEFAHGVAIAALAKSGR